MALFGRRTAERDPARRRRRRARRPRRGRLRRRRRAPVRGRQPQSQPRRPPSRLHHEQRLAHGRVRRGAPRANSAWTTAPADVVTSPQAAMRLLVERVAPGSTVLVVGGDGLVSELEKAGFVVTRSAEDAPAAVVQGFAPEVGLGAARRGRVRPRAAGGGGRHPVDRDQHRLDDPAGARHRAGQRHARVRRAHGGRSPRDRRGQARGADLRRGGRALRGAASALPR